MPRDAIYPPLDPFQTGTLQVDPIHRVYWEQCGNPHGAPVLFLHGGPGAGASPMHRRFFDPAHYRIVIMDPRGAGRSRPPGEIRNNTQAHLIADIAVLRERLGIDGWTVFRGPWGSVLAPAYAPEPPGPCLPHA